MTQRAEKDNDPASTETRRVADATGAGPRTWCARVWPPAPAARPAPAPRSRAEPSAVPHSQRQTPGTISQSLQSRKPNRT